MAGVSVRLRDDPWPLCRIWCNTRDNFSGDYWFRDFDCVTEWNIANFHYWLGRSLQTRDHATAPPTRHVVVSEDVHRANSAFHLSGVGKWVPASAGKERWFNVGSYPHPLCAGFNCTLNHCTSSSSSSSSGSGSRNFHRVFPTSRDEAFYHIWLISMENWWDLRQNFIIDVPWKMKFPEYFGSNLNLDSDSRRHSPRHIYMRFPSVLLAVIYTVSQKNVHFFIFQIIVSKINRF